MFSFLPLVKMPAANGAICIIIITLHLLLGSHGFGCDDADVCSTVVPYCELEGNEGTIMTISCGEPEPGATFTYRNVTNNFAVIASNVTDCLMLNLTAFHNGTIINCGTNSLPQIRSFVILVNYSPKILGDFSSNFGRFERDYELKCPLTGRPQPSYSWQFEDCFNGEPVTPNGISLINNNRTVYINSLTLEFQDTCFFCTATNTLGQNTYSLGRIIVDYCVAPNYVMTISPDNPTVIVGDSITLLCNVIGVSFPYESLNWFFNDNERGILGLDPNFNDTTCLGSLSYTITNASHEDAGKYSCFYGYDTSQSVQLRVVDTGNVDASTLAGYITPSIIVVLIASIVVVMGIMFAVVVRNKINKKQMLPLEIELGDGFKNIEYDVFVSFAEEDRAFAENKIKAPLEKKGYRISWHHEVFIPGCSIVENMEKFIFESRVTVVVISNNFTSSDFCTKELYIALRKEKQNAMSCVIPVLMGSSCSVPEPLMKKTYLIATDKNFFERLQSAIGEPLDPSP